VTYAHLRDVSVDRRSGRVAFTGGTEQYEVWVLAGVLTPDRVP
jgi:hypothetical protein